MSEQCDDVERAAEHEMGQGGVHRVPHAGEQPPAAQASRLLLLLIIVTQQQK